MSVINLEDIKPKMALTGTVKRLELTGALLDVGTEYDAVLLNVNMVSRGSKSREGLSVGDQVPVYVLGVDAERNLISVSTAKPPELEWDDIKVGDVYRGRVNRIKKFGVFVDIGAERLGMVHISELAHEYVSAPQDVVKRGQEIDVKVIGVDTNKKQIDLSVKALEMSEAEKVESFDDEPYEELPTAMALAFEKARKSDNNTKSEKQEIRKKSVATKEDRDEIFRRTLEGREQ